jgi:hypothetical protein
VLNSTVSAKAGVSKHTNVEIKVNTFIVTERFPFAHNSSIATMSFLHAYGPTAPKQCIGSEATSQAFAFVD